MNDLSEYEKAIFAVRDVLYMYKTLINYEGFFDDFGIEDGNFNPFEYINCNPKLLGISAQDASLLHEGSAIKIICHILFLWGQGNHPQESIEFIENTKNLLMLGDANHIPELKQAISLCIESDDKFWLESKWLYEKYVLDFFKSLCK